MNKPDIEMIEQYLMLDVRGEFGDRELQPILRDNVAWVPIGISPAGGYFMAALIWNGYDWYVMGKDGRPRRELGPVTGLMGAFELIRDSDPVTRPLPKPEEEEPRA